MKKSIVRILALSLVAVMMCVVLVSCGGPNADPDKALASLKDNEYSAAEDKLLIPTALRLLGVDDIDTVITGTNKDGEHVTVIYFEDKAAANDAWEDVQEYFEETSDEDSNWTIKKSGAMIYWGTSAGIKAAK
ncbi:MAG: hypothetical protein IJ345_01390 [Clostridia bacterium]|nr:hypothetical protein [Clostridia bacterium]